jgi:uncharacterized damage-inducible protein DinB
VDVELVRGLYDYHRWANRRLLDVAAGLGEETTRREVGPQFSVSTLKGMFAHIYGTDFVWLERWKGTSPTRLPSDEDFPDLATLRKRWDPLEQQQRQFVEGLSGAALGRLIEYRNTKGKAFRLPLWTLLQHVANHGTHHRSEIATMLTILSGSPPFTDFLVYHLERTGQV